MPFGLCNSPAVFQRLMQQVLMGLNPPEAPGFVSVYIDDVLVFSKTLQEHLSHLKLVIQRLQEVGLKLKPEKCKYACKQVEYLGHVISSSGLKPNHKLTAAVCDFPTPRNVKEVRRFLGLTSYYRKFIPGFARVAEPLHRLTRKDVEFSWTTDCQISFDTLKKKLTEAPLLAYPSFDRDFVLETDASIHGLGAILSQVQDDHKSHPIAYASRALSTAEKNYGITELETLAVVWAMSHYHYYLYGHCVTVYTDHSAVKALLETPNPTGKHARWWTKVFAQGVRRVHIVYKAGKENVNADALSRSPHAPAPLVGDVEEEVQVAVIDVSQVPATGDTCRTDISSLLLANPVSADTLSRLSVEQKKDLSLQEIFEYLEQEKLPNDVRRAQKIAAQAPSFVITKDILYLIDSNRGNRKRAVVPQSLKKQIMMEGHGGRLGGHFSGQRTYNSLAYHWWWKRMYYAPLISDTCSTTLSNCRSRCNGSTQNVTR